MTAFFPNTRILAAASFLASVSVAAFAHDLSTHKHETTSTAEGSFLEENDAAMAKMMNGMAVKPTGNANRDFVEMMIPHHQGAVDMAVTYLRYGDNEQLKRIAQEIIVDQQQEIAAMRMALGDPLPASEAVPTQVDPATTTTSQSLDEQTPSRAAAMQMTMKPAN